MSLAEDVPAGLGGVDAFRVLGLAYSPDLTDAEVRAAYPLRLRAVHPDNGGDTGAAAAVTAAYDALRSAVRRGELLAALTLERADRPGGGAAGGWRVLWLVRDRAGSPPRLDGPARPGTGRVPDAARREELWRKMSAARVAQGLPPFITDEATLDKIAHLLVATLGQHTGTRRAAQCGSNAADGAAAGHGTVADGLVAAGAVWPAVVADRPDRAGRAGCAGGAARRAG